MSETKPPPPSGLPTVSDQQRPLLVGVVGLLLALGVARSAGPGGLSAIMALLLMVGVPLVGLSLVGPASRLFFLAAALGGWLVFRPTYEGGMLALPGLVLARLAYFSVPPLVLSLALSERDSDRLKLGPLHLYAPAVVMVLGSLVHLAVRWNAQSAEAEIRRAAFIYAGCYLFLIAIALLLRLAPAPKAAAIGPDRALEFEEAGRFGLAAQHYERQGDLEKGAQAAERAADWPRAARLYERSGEQFNAAEMYYRAQMLPQALECYEKARAFPAAARLCVQLGQVERALDLLEQASYAAAVVQTLEQAGVRLTAEQYRKAGMMERSAQVFEDSGQFLRAAEIQEHDLQDSARAADLYVKAGSFVQAGRLLESLGRRQEALEAYAATPAGAFEAARLYAASGRAREAADLLARLPAAQLEKIGDDATSEVVARVMLDTGRTDEAARMLQGLKRRGSPSGVVHLLLGRVFLAKGLQDLAEEELQFAVSLPLEPADEIHAHYLLGCVLEKAGKTEPALQVFHGILQKDLNYKDVQERYRRLKSPRGE